MHLQYPHWSDDKCLEMVYAQWQFILDIDQKPFMVESAFGGLGLYKASWLRRAQVPYCGEQARLLPAASGGAQLLRWQVAEHVSFHAGLRAAGFALASPRLD